jgi:hypothetical protein
MPKRFYLRCGKDGACMAAGEGRAPLRRGRLRHLPKIGRDQRHAGGIPRNFLRVAGAEDIRGGQWAAPSCSSRSTRHHSRHGIAWALFRRLPLHYSPSSNVGNITQGAPACSRRYSKA